MKIMVAYDGTLEAKEALIHAMDKARLEGGEVVVLHVFNNGLFIDYDAHPDAEAMARLESARFIEEAKSLLHEKGRDVKISLFSTEGNPEKEMIGFAKEQHADVLLCPPKLETISRKYKRAMKKSEPAGEASNLLTVS